MKVRIENSYTDGHESSRVVELDEEPTLDEIEDWWEEVVYDETGDGHGAWDGVGERLGSCYTATVTEAANPDLVGQTNEWID